MNLALDLSLASLARAPRTVAPSFTSNPVIVGSSTVGQILTCIDGTAVGTPPSTITRQWKKNGVDISGATGLSLDTTGMAATDVITVANLASNGVSPDATAISASITLSTTAFTVTPIGNNNTVSGTSVTVTTTVAVAAGESLVLQLSHGSSSALRTIASVVDSVGNVWVPRKNIVTSFREAALWECLNPLPMSIGATITVTGNATFGGIRAEVFKLNRRAGRSTIVDASQTNTSGTAASTAGGTYKTGNAVFVAGILASSSGITNTSTMTMTNQNVDSRRIFNAWKVPTADEVTAFTGTITSATWSTCMAGYA